MAVDLAKVIEDETYVKKTLDEWSRGRQLIALRYLRGLLGIPIDETYRAIEKEYQKIRHA